MEKFVVKKEPEWTKGETTYRGLGEVELSFELWLSAREGFDAVSGRRSLRSSMDPVLSMLSRQELLCMCVCG